MKRQNGLTLIELLITIVVLTTILALGVPSFMQFIKNNRITAQANSVVISVQLARNEAIKRGSGSVICASTDQATCSGDDDWTNGWIVFSDLNRNGAPDTGATNPLCEPTEDCIMRTANSLSRSTLDGGGTDNIRFLPNGLTTSTTAMTLTLTSNDCYSNQIRDITITRQGHTMITKQPCP
jgi:type IV fimbrial biogenesis protein FimT